MRARRTRGDAPDPRREEPLDSDTASECTYPSSDRGLRHDLGMSDPADQVPNRLSIGEALIVITLASLAFWAVIVAAICSLASALFA
jgi:hypothetical protein